MLDPYEQIQDELAQIQIRLNALCDSSPDELSDGVDTISEMLSSVEDTADELNSSLTQESERCVLLEEAAEKWEERAETLEADIYKAEDDHDEEMANLRGKLPEDFENHEYRWDDLLTAVNPLILQHNFYEKLTEITAIVDRGVDSRTQTNR